MEETLRSSATLRGRIAEVGLDESFRFQTIQGGVDSADRDFAFGAKLNLLPDGNSVRAIRKAHECKDYDVFEFAEVIATGHYLYNIDEMVRDKPGDHWSRCLLAMRLMVCSDFLINKILLPDQLKLLQLLLPILRDAPRILTRHQPVVSRLVDQQLSDALQFEVRWIKLS